MLAEWHEFYALLGTAAAALVALLFVAASIGASADARNRSRRHAHLHEPGRVPLCQRLVSQPYRAHSDADLGDPSGSTIGIASMAALIYSLVILVARAPQPIADLADRLCLWRVPVVCYAAGLVSALLLLEESTGGP